MVTRLKDGINIRHEHLQYALDTLHNQANNLEQLNKKIASSKTTWLVAQLADGLAQNYTAHPLPLEFTIIATDGSHIDVDRHRSTKCYLINIGSVILHYGRQPAANLDSYPCLYSEDEDRVITPIDSKIREQPVEGTLLGIKRGVDELHKIVTLAQELPRGSTSLALLDGTLILWGLEAYPEFVSEVLLNRGFLNHLEEIRRLNEDRRLALISYISFPRSTDVVNALRVAICPHDVADCDRYCTINPERDCDKVAGVRDEELFSSLLNPWERSALFISSSKIQKRYGNHQIYFCYLKVGDEIARIEMPKWVATDSDLLNLMHTLVLDQCQRGQRYPVALSEAHEQAVITNSDKANFWQLVELSLVEENISSFRSEKSRSKRSRWI